MGEKGQKKGWTKEKGDALEHLIEETLSKAYNTQVEKENELLCQTLNNKKKADFKIPKVEKLNKNRNNHRTSSKKINFKPHLTKEEYFDLINSVIDPETGIGISDMGLIYDVTERANGLIEIKMTLTSMGCPAGAQITTEIDAWLRLQKHVKDVKIDIVWDPPWNLEMMNPNIKAMMFGN